MVHSLPNSAMLNRYLLIPSLGLPDETLVVLDAGNVDVPHPLGQNPSPGYGKPKK
jgi:hypothetical protein